jgi:hypothetical protein
MLGLRLRRFCDRFGDAAKKAPWYWTQYKALQDKEQDKEFSYSKRDEEAYSENLGRGFKKRIDKDKNETLEG